MRQSKLLLLLLFMLALQAAMFGQYTTVDFEPAGQGASWTWTTAENAGNPPLTFPANPVSGGINTSATVAQFTALAAGAPWALCFTDGIEPFVFNATNSIVKIMVYKPVLSNVGIKFEGTSAPLELTVANTVINQWQELTFDFSAAIGNTYSRIVIIPDFLGRAQDNVIYFDNIRIPDGNVVPPAVATLSDLRVDNVTIAGFSPAVLNYYYQVSGTRTPVLAATKTDPNATLEITQATSIPGFATAVVTAVDGTTTLTYTVNYFRLLAPDTAPPVPTEAPEDVISIYSDAYTNIPGTNFDPDWGQQTVVTVDEVIAGNNTLHYQNLNYQGTQYTFQDVSAYQALHVDFWTVSSTDLGFYLISPGQETQYLFTIVPGTWGSVDIPLSHFVPPVNLANVFQFKVRGNGEIWFDNLYFWKNPTAAGTDATLSDLQIDDVTVNGFAPLTQNYVYGLDEGTVTPPRITSVVTTDPNADFEIHQAEAVPGTASVLVTAQDGVTTRTYTVAFSIVYPNSIPPIPSQNAANVISMFSDSYPNVPVDTWLTPWSEGAHENVIVAGNLVKKYTNVNYVGIETTGPSLLDLSGMDYVHIDLWTPDANNFRFKLVDWGADAAWGGGDDTEHELTYPAPATGHWISYDIPLTNFTGLGSTAHMAQYILSKSPLGTMYIDNMYFYTVGNIPANVVITRTGNQVSLTWDAVPGATYKVYSSTNPYAGFTEDLSGTFITNSWSAAVSGLTRFYYVTASTD